MVKEKDQELVS